MHVHRRVLLLGRHAFGNCQHRAGLQLGLLLQLHASTGAHERPRHGGAQGPVAVDHPLHHHGLLLQLRLRLLLQGHQLAASTTDVLHARGGLVHAGRGL
jgi:hypothetical protein